MVTKYVCSCNTYIPYNYTFLWDFGCLLDAPFPFAADVYGINRQCICFVVTSHKHAANACTYDITFVFGCLACLGCLVCLGRSWSFFLLLRALSLSVSATWHSALVPRKCVQKRSNTFAYMYGMQWLTRSQNLPHVFPILELTENLGTHSEVIILSKFGLDQ